MADPECREVAAHSHMTLLRIETEAEEVVQGQKHLEIATKETLLAKLVEVRAGRQRAGGREGGSSRILHASETSRRLPGDLHFPSCCSNPTFTSTLLQIIAHLAKLDTSAGATLEYIASLALNLIRAKNYKLEDWKVVSD